MVDDVGQIYHCLMAFVRWDGAVITQGRSIVARDVVHSVDLGWEAWQFAAYPRNIFRPYSSHHEDASVVLSRRLSDSRVEDRWIV